MILLHEIASRLGLALWGWYDAKHFLERSVAFSSDAIHVIVGVLIQLGSALVLRRSISSWRPWLVVLALLCFNEFVDLYLERWPVRVEQYGESAKDLLLTMLLPTALLLASRWRPRIFARS